MDTTVKTQKTLGEKRVRTDFNAAVTNIVDDINKKAAELINLINAIPIKDGVDTGEFARCRAKALTEIEDGSMWAVKAATF